MKILVTGAAGFLGSALCRFLAQSGHHVMGLDSFTSYYSPEYKQERVAELQNITGVTIVNADISSQGYEDTVASFKPDTIVHLAAQPGVRDSMQNPQQSVALNVLPFVNLLETARRHNVRHTVYASSSSVYGNGKSNPEPEQGELPLPEPMNEKDDVAPLSVYAVSKCTMEQLANVYARQYGMSITGLRFFTVYGPWGRPDMAPMLFAQNILADRPVQIFGNGKALRDFTYIDDAIRCISAVINDGQGIRPHENEINSSHSPHTGLQEVKGMGIHEIFNIGRGEPASVEKFAKTLAKALRKPVTFSKQSEPEGDAKATYADTSAFRARFGFSPSTSLGEGVAKFAAWLTEKPNGDKSIKSNQQ